MKDSIRRRLEKTVERFEEVGALLADPDVIGRQNQFRELSMEYARLEPVAARFREFRRLEDERLASGAINATYITATAIAERGARPSALLDEYGFDGDYVTDYARAAKTEDGFRAWLDREVFGTAQKVAAE